MRIRDDETPGAGIHVDTKGKVTARHPLEDDAGARHDPDYPEALRKQRAAVEAWQKKIDLIVDKCKETGESFKRALEANVTDRPDFNAPEYWYLRLGKDAAPKDGAQYRGTRIMDRLALAVKECAHQGSPRKYAVLVELGESKPVPEDVADRRKALKEFINGFVPSALKAQGCS